MYIVIYPDCSKRIFYAPLGILPGLDDTLWIQPGLDSLDMELVSKVFAYESDMLMIIYDSHLLHTKPRPENVPTHCQRYRAWVKSGGK
ncbi:hypothetical protein CDAR_250561 [Caerostris darwini]|uniref:Uncharacterized protein n=1 Tax=Caerostris darwini TaxID=1538125 RepID=A0AAV4UEA6_9ARAC|nr:hypothetical protein CDAR_250561 [Caerostris darwini]